MNHNIDQIIDRFAHLTHTPRGRYAASDETYKQLLSRLKEAPIAEKATPHIGRTRRWSVAASATLIVGISIAIAGVYAWHEGYISGEVPPQQQSSESGMTAVQTLVFDNQPLTEIASILTNTYDVNIRIEDAELANYKVTATFHTDESLDDVLDILAEVAGFTYEDTIDGIVIRKVSNP